MQASRYTIVGVIGHIDHGKTSLVAALTGVDTDTHPEEKQRGITIDLGFASFRDRDREFALIDAPGHQKYIGNLLAGVSGVDLGLLVVACDQGIEAQTLEHASILQTLGVTQLVVAMSRIDLVDPSAVDELSEELEVFLADYGYSDIPMIPLSSVTGQGLDALRQQLHQSADEAEACGHARPQGSDFRMPVDRVFSVPGRGCVVAGTVWTGDVSIGDHLQIASSGAQVRVREIEVHGESVETSQIGRRTAMNVTGASHTDFVRGEELIAPDSHWMSTHLLIEIKMFRETGALKCPGTVQLHSATGGCEARVTGIPLVEPGASEVVLVELDRPIVATFGQQCLFRKPYPVGSFAGGRVLVGLGTSLRERKKTMQLGQTLVIGQASERLAAWVEYRGQMVPDPRWLQQQLGIPAEQLSELIEQAVGADVFVRLGDRLLISHDTLQRIRGYVLKILTSRAEGTEDPWMVEEALIEKASSAGDPDAIKAVIAELLKSGEIVTVNHMLALASEKTTLSKKQRAMMQQILQTFQDNRQPPTAKEIAEKHKITKDAAQSLLRFATQQTILTDLGKGFIISTAVFEQLCDELRGLFDETAEQAIPAIKEKWGITRKHVIPLLEYCDKHGYTARKGDARIAGPKLLADQSE